MRIGIICGKDDEEYLDKSFNKKIPSKYKINGKVHTDIALAFIMKNSFPEHTIDIILPNEISSARLQRNSINIPVGYDVINAINDDPFIKKFSGKVLRKNQKCKPRMTIETTLLVNLEHLYSNMIAIFFLKRKSTQHFN